jgi:hypothetical protein
MSATCANCLRPFDGTAWQYRPGDGARIHVDCHAYPPTPAGIYAAELADIESRDYYARTAHLHRRSRKRIRTR